MLRHKLISLMLCYLLIPYSWGTIGTGNSVCTNVEEVSDTSLACTVAVENAEAGNIMICRLGIDNTGTGDGTDSEVASVVAGSDNCTFLAAFRNGQGTAATGAQVEAWRCLLTAQLDSGSGTITVTTANTITDKTMYCNEFTVDAGNSLRIEGAVQTEASDNADAGSLATSSLANKEHLHVRAIATESNAAVSMTATGTFSLAPADGCINTATGGEASDMGICTEVKISTSTGETSDPTLVDTSNDNASIFFALEEFTPPARNRAVVIQ